MNRVSSDGSLRPLPLSLWLCGACALLLSIAACEDTPTGGTVEIPLQVVFNFPADQGCYGSLRDEVECIGDTGVVSPSFDFNRAAKTIEEFTLLVHPTPDATGEILLTKRGKNLTWFDLDPPDDSVVQRIIIGGPEMLRPFELKWFTGQPPVAFFSGTIFSDNATTHRADRVVIFLISPQSGFAPSDPAGFDDIPRLGFMVPDAFTEDPETSQNYQFSHLAPGLEVFVVAVLDTSGDGRYRPEDDWWGYHKLDGELDPVAVTAVPLPVTASDPIPRGNVHITLRAP